MENKTKEKKTMRIQTLSNGWMDKCEKRFGQIVAIAQKSALLYKEGKDVTQLNRTVELRVEALSQEEKRELKDYVQKLAWGGEANLGVVKLIAPERYLFTAEICKAISAGLTFNVFRVRESVINLLLEIEKLRQKASKEERPSEAISWRMMLNDILRHCPPQWLNSLLIEIEKLRQKASNENKLFEAESWREMADRIKRHYLPQRLNGDQDK
ncbi:MAG: hypothetical protein ACP5QN_01610 [Minisyncoccia bacterium]